MPLAGACLLGSACQVVIAPDADVSVVRTGPCWVRTPLLMTPMYAPVTPSWSVEE